jgi:hypothetical protein
MSNNPGGRSDGPSRPAKRQWQKPVLMRIEAGSAETGTKSNQFDATGSGNIKS